MKLTNTVGHAGVEKEGIVVRLLNASKDTQLVFLLRKAPVHLYKNETYVVDCDEETYGKLEIFMNGIKEQVGTQQKLPTRRGL